MATQQALVTCHSLSLREFADLLIQKPVSQNFGVFTSVKLLTSLRIEQVFWTENLGYFLTSTQAADSLSLRADS
jgi:hypothetical protein